MTEKVSGIGNTYALNWFQKICGIIVLPLENGLEIDVFFLGLGIMTVLCPNHKVSVIPTDNILVSFQAIRSFETNVISSEAEGVITSGAA